MKKYSELVAEWLVEAGYTHCFFVPGGNSMHMLDGVRTRMTCIAFVHEVSAAIAAEYFNQISTEGKALLLLTAGPGLTNAMTGIAGCYQENRELLVIGGQVKSSDLSDGLVRQRGIQEIDGVALTKPITVEAVRLTSPIPKTQFMTTVNRQWEGTPGPVFIEMCLDVQGASVDEVALSKDAISTKVDSKHDATSAVAAINAALASSERPVLLIGGGVSHPVAEALHEQLNQLGIPVMTTYNGADRVSSDHPLYFGRPNTWGMRYSNLLVGQADLVVALGTRLGLQQTGFNWQEFTPVGRIIQVDINEAELRKGHPRIDEGFAADANEVLKQLVSKQWTDSLGWVHYCRSVKAALPLSEANNSVHPGFHNPYDFLLEMSEVAEAEDLVVPSSSGGAFTAFYQAFLNKRGQRIVSDKSLASMGYGLAGAIGASLSSPHRRVLHVEGDGSFAQNLQELATVAVRGLNLKMFLWYNEGYASIRMTQRNYFGGQYLGCDVDTGLGFPDWIALCGAYGIDARVVEPGFSSNADFLEALREPGPALYVVNVHREQTFLPKIASRVTASGSMESEPLWQISPHLSDEQLASLGRYLPTSK